MQAQTADSSPDSLKPRRGGPRPNSGGRRPGAGRHAGDAVTFRGWCRAIVDDPKTRKLVHAAVMSQLEKGSADAWMRIAEQGYGKPPGLPVEGGSVTVNMLVINALSSLDAAALEAYVTSGALPEPK